MTIKKLSAQKNDDKKENRLDFTQGVNFGLGFMTAVVIFSMIIIPALFCSVLIILSWLGVAIGGG